VIVALDGPLGELTGQGKTLTNRTMIDEGGGMIPCICEFYEKIPIKRI
jgi:hypothetical protein